MAGRPPIGERVEVRLPPDVLVQVDRLLAAAKAERPTTSRSDIIRELVVAGLRRRR